MSRSTTLLAVGAAALLATTLTACGTATDEAAPAASASATPSGELLTTLDREGHQLRDLPAADAPTVEITVEPDPMGGFNVHTVTGNFRWAPEHASGDHVPGEGHAHVYVDGEKLSRVYSEWFFIGPMAMEPGMHEVTVTINGNDHNQYAADGEPVEATVTVEAMEMDDEHMH